MTSYETTRIRKGTRRALNGSLFKREYAPKQSRAWGEMQFSPLRRRGESIHTSTSFSDSSRAGSSQADTAATYFLTQLPDSVGISGSFRARLMHWARMRDACACHMSYMMWCACKAHGPMNWAHDPRSITSALPHACAATPVTYFTIYDTRPTVSVIQSFHTGLSSMVAAWAGQDVGHRSGGHGDSMGGAGARWHSRRAGLGRAGRCGHGLGKALHLPSGSFQEDVTDNQLGPREKLFG